MTPKEYKAVVFGLFSIKEVLKEFLEIKISIWTKVRRHPFNIYTVEIRFYKHRFLVYFFRQFLLVVTEKINKKAIC